MLRCYASYLGSLYFLVNVFFFSISWPLILCGLVFVLGRGSNVWKRFRIIWLALIMFLSSILPKKIFPACCKLNYRE